MANPTVGAIQGEYAEILEACWDRWTAAALESRNGTYTADRFVSDATAHWADMAWWWCIPANTIYKKLNTLPRLFMEIPAPGGNATAAIFVPDAGTTNVSSTNLTDLAGAATDILASKVVTTYSQPQRILIVQLVGLSGLTKDTTYKGTINAATVPARAIADLFLTVT